MTKKNMVTYLGLRGLIQLTDVTASANKTCTLRSDQAVAYTSAHRVVHNLPLHLLHHPCLSVLVQSNVSLASIV